MLFFVLCFILFDFQVVASPVSDAVPQNAAAHIAPALQQVLIICRFTFFLNCQLNYEMHNAFNAPNRACTNTSLISLFLLFFFSRSRRRLLLSGITRECRRHSRNCWQNWTFWPEKVCVSVIFYVKSTVSGQFLHWDTCMFFIDTACVHAIHFLFDVLSSLFVCRKMDRAVCDHSRSWGYTGGCCFYLWKKDKNDWMMFVFLDVCCM